MGDMPTLVASIVLHQPDPGILGLTLRSLSATLSRAYHDGLLGKASLILVDHSPQPQPEAVIAGWQAQCGLDLPLTYFSDPGNPGFGAGHNRAFELAGSHVDYFLAANPDLEFATDSLAAGLKFLGAHPQTGLLAPALIKGNGETAPACFRYPDLLTLALRFIGGPLAATRSRRYEYRDWDARQPVFNPPLISGCCMLFRSDCYAALQGFDPSYFLYFEDFDLSWRAGKQGLSAYCPEMRIRHLGGDAARKGTQHIRYFLCSALRFFRSHGWRWC